MTMAANQPPNAGWSCELIASPASLYPKERLLLHMRLHQPELDQLSPEEIRDFIRLSCQVSFHSTEPRLNELLRVHADGTAVISEMPALPPGTYEVHVHVKVLNYDHWPKQGRGRPSHPNQTPHPLSATASFSLASREIDANVTLRRSASRPTDDQALWAAIRNRTDAISFPRYQRFIDQVFGQSGNLVHGVQGVRDAFDRSSFWGTGDRNRVILGTQAYGVLKLATQAFLTLEAGIYLDPRLFEEDTEAARFDDTSITAEGLERRLEDYLSHSGSQVAMLPYLRRIASAYISLDQINHKSRQDGAPSLDYMLRQRLIAPSMIELIWSYWQEQGMLVQTMNAIAQRFQNRRGSEKDPLIELEFDTLRPLSNILWGYIQDEQNRLTVSRRAHEYHHHYGLSLEGKAVEGLYPADSRSKFIEAFHNLLYRTELFYKEDRDTTMIADAFPLLNALREVHLLLAEGAHNQFGDLTWTARAEMLMTQWMLARQEMKDFLRGRYAVPYQEGWMGAVDSMKRLQGWDATSVTHYHELAVTGERILLSIRYGDWVNSSNIEEQAKNWARNLKPEIQRYLFDYRTVTGVDLTSSTTDTRDAGIRFAQPSALLQQRLVSQRAKPIGPPEAGLRALRPPSPASVEMPARPMARLPRSGTTGQA